jgi:hypothetical protein
VLGSSKMIMRSDVSATRKTDSGKRVTGCNTGAATRCTSQPAMGVVDTPPPPPPVNVINERFICRRTLREPNIIASLEFHTDWFVAAALLLRLLPSSNTTRAAGINTVGGADELGIAIVNVESINCRNTSKIDDDFILRWRATASTNNDTYGHVTLLLLLLLENSCTRTRMSYGAMSEEGEKEVVALTAALLPSPPAKRFCTRYN